jgi:hypothetical protein
VFEPPPAGYSVSTSPVVSAAATPASTNADASAAAPAQYFKSSPFFDPS